jgi:hypothetical protein
MNIHKPTPYYAQIDPQFIVNITEFAWETLSITWNIPHPETDQPYAIFHFTNQEEIWLQLELAKKIWRAMNTYLTWYKNQAHLNQTNQDTATNPEGETRKYA